MGSEREKLTSHDPIPSTATLDAILEQHRPALGADFPGYRHHTCRVLSLCRHFNPALDVEKIAIAAAFHDLGIWTHHTFDYLTPSAELAASYLQQVGRGSWTPEITRAILDHHKLSASRADDGSLAEPFRRADWIDVTRGVLNFGLPRGVVRRLYERWPSAGFHWRLVQLSARRLREHPLSPLPMLRL